VKVLCVVQHFRQGWGGAPESARLLAAILAEKGYSFDVFDLGQLRHEIERLDLLPEPGTPAERFDMDTLPRYGAIAVLGPWQNPRWLKPVLRARRKDQSLIYLPRGGLGRIEFSRVRDLKKWPYLYLIERPILDASSAVVFSSQCERRNAVSAARERAPEVVIPDLFQAPVRLVREAEGARRAVRVSFMAEISPRNALVPMVEAFRLFAENSSLTVPVRLVVGGSVRKGSEAYADRARELAGRLPSSASVDFVGPVSHDRRGEFYRDTDVFLVPSLFESFGLTVLEALAAGCATIAGPNLGVLEFLPPNERLGVARAIEPVALAEELLRQYKLALDQDDQVRAATAAYCQDAIAAMNAQAIDSWIELLEA
jgi:glycosyltransferase involved in cell wall biosynthesis